MITTVMWGRETLAHSGAMRSALRMSQVPQVTLVPVSVWGLCKLPRLSSSPRSRGAAQPRPCPGHADEALSPSLSDPEYLIKFKPS